MRNLLHQLLRRLDGVFQMIQHEIDGLLLARHRTVYATLELLEVRRDADLGLSQPRKRTASEHVHHKLVLFVRQLVAPYSNAIG